MNLFMHFGIYGHWPMPQFSKRHVFTNHKMHLRSYNFLCLLSWMEYKMQYLGTFGTDIVKSILVVNSTT